MTAESGRFLMVELQPGLHPNRIRAFMQEWVGMAGVVSVVDLSAISRQTLDTFLLQPEPVAAKTAKRKRPGTRWVA